MSPSLNQLRCVIVVCLLSCAGLIYLVFFGG